MTHYTNNELRQIADTLDVSVDHQVVDRVIDSAKRYLIYWRGKDELADAKKTKSELGRILNAAVTLMTMLSNASPETRHLLSKADAKVTQSGLGHFEAYLRQVYDGAILKASFPSGPAPKSRRNELWVELENIIKERKNEKVSRKNPHALANKFIQFCCNRLPGDHSVSHEQLYDAIKRHRRPTGEVKVKSCLKGVSS